MTNVETKAVQARRTATAWSIDGYDGQTHYGDVLKALAPAFFILSAVAALMVTIL